ncbi:hypothetical protein BJ165DRAFT_1437071 [Panaeolus papilionaceus]|nr:hypothetical protein BJ165DRAFT_1437071 [Panaeolus papilionaceus]
MDAEFSLIISKLVSSLIITSALVFLYAWVMRVIVGLTSSPGHILWSASPNVRVMGCQDSVSDPRPRNTVKPDAPTQALANHPLRSIMMGVQGGSTNAPHNAATSATTLTRNFGWPLELSTTEHNQNTGELVEGSGIHLQLYINNARTLITGSTFSSVTTTEEREVS